MLCASALRWLCLSVFVFSVMVQAKSQKKLTEDCDWYCWVEDRIDDLTNQMAKLWQIMDAGDYNPPNSIGSISTSTTTSTRHAMTETTTRTTTKSFGNSYTTPTSYGPSAIVTVSPSNSNAYLNPTNVPARKPDPEDRDGYRAVAYFGNWDIYARKYYPQNIPAKSLTHLLYSFADNRADGTVFLTDSYADTDIHFDGDSWSDSGKNVYGSIKQLGLLKQKNRNLKVLLSIGGWTYTNEKKHMDPVSDAGTRKAFADSCVDMIRDYGFDGIDVDWEYPQDSAQGQDFLKLLQAIRQALNDYSDFLAKDKGSAKEAKPHFLLSIAAPAGEDNYRNLPLNDMARVLDFVNLMAYDYSGSWDKTASHASNLAPSKSNPKSTPFNTESVIAHYISAGIPSNKLNLGMPLYGRAFTNTAGLGQSYNGVGKGTWEAGVYDFKDLPLSGSKVYFDKEAYATYSYDNSTNTLISFDTVEMALKKVDYIKQKELGGAMWWEVSGDRTDGGSIISNVVKELSGANGKGIESKANWLYYPDSSYDNVKAGFAA